MSLYNRNFIKLDINLEKTVKIGEGSNSKVYKYNDIAIKKYCSYTLYPIDEKVFEIISSIKNKHLIELYELFTMIDDKEYERNIELYLSKKTKFVIDGYTSKYYNQERINPLNENSSYLLQNIEELKELFDLFSYKNILAKDLNEDNSLITTKGIIIIDPDFYKFCDLNYNQLINRNNVEFLHYIRALFLWYGNPKKVYPYLRKLISEQRYSIDEIEKDLKKVKKPIHLFDE